MPKKHGNKGKIVVSGINGDECNKAQSTPVFN